MAGSVPTIFWFDRFDERIGILPVVGELVHTEELNGEDTLEFECREVPLKGDMEWLHLTGHFHEGLRYRRKEVPAWQTPSTPGSFPRSSSAR